MAENLSTTKYSDGTSIPNVTDEIQWAGLTTPAYCWYGNDVSYKNPYGALYNWYAINTGKLAPAGWRVPNESEWNTLITYLGGSSIAAGKMKEAGLAHWLNPNTEADNSSGFTGLPGSVRLNGTGFSFMLEEGAWWTSATSSTQEYAFYHYLVTNSAAIDDFNILNYKVDGFSVRWVKD